MPPTNLVFYREDDGSVPPLDWLDRMPEKVQDKCLVRIERLQALGHEIRRPEADFLRDGVYELRVGLQGVHYRMLYFFSGRSIVVVSHGLVKRRAIPDKDIELAIARKRRFEADPERHTHREEVE